MKGKKSVVFLAIAFFFVIFQLPSLCFSQTKNVYHNPDGHFSFIVPDEWTEIPKDILSEFAKSANKLSETKSELSTGFYYKEKSSTYMLLLIKKREILREWTKAIYIKR